MNNWIKTAIAFCTLVGMVYGSTQIFAKASDLEKVEVRLEQKIVYDNIDRIQSRIWQIEDRYQKKSMPSEIKGHIKELKREMERELVKVKKDQSNDTSSEN